MLVLFSLILLVIGAALIGGIYAMFTPFIDQLWSIQHYNIAYYGAISSLERSYLILRWHQPGFEGEWWWGANNANYGPLSDQYEKNSKKYWGIMSVGDNGQKWEIKSMIPSGTTIPFSGNGNVDADMADSDSFEFNKLEFGSPIQIALYKDTTISTEDFYQTVPGWNINDIALTTNNLTVNMRVPPKILTEFGVGKGLNDENTYNWDADGDGIGDDTVAIRSLFGLDNNSEEFSIIPKIDVDYTPWSEAVKDGDSSIRESNINNGDDITFGNKINPISGHDDSAGLYVIPTDAENLSGKNLNDILNGNLNTTRMHLKLSLANILKHPSNSVYPYLEVKIDAWTQIPDLFYHITAQSTIGKYNVKIYKDRPIFDTSEAGDYVILF